jgi:hypothetical protein
MRMSAENMYDLCSNAAYYTNGIALRYPVRGGSQRITSIDTDL